MNLLDAITSEQGGAAIGKLSDMFGLDPKTTESAVGQLLPALSTGLKRNTASEGGLGSLLGALKKDDHEQYLDRPEKLAEPKTTEDGNKILGHILGSKDVSRAVAKRASENTGVGEGILKKMLPLVASLAMGSLGKQTKSAGLLPGLDSGGLGGILGMLGPMLDADKSGSMADDILDMFTKGR